MAKIARASSLLGEMQASCREESQTRSPPWQEESQGERYFSFSMASLLSCRYLGNLTVSTELLSSHAEETERRQRGKERACRFLMKRCFTMLPVDLDQA